MLEANGLILTYRTSQGPWRAVDDVSFRIEEGEFFTLLGPSGCGKTSTLRAIAGLEIPSEGRIALGDRVLFDVKAGVNLPANKRDLGMVFQSYAIWPHMSVAANVAFPLEVRGASKQEAREGALKALSLVGLTHLADRSATALSGGQQQRVALARAIARPVKLLLFDEPLSNLDVELRVQMRIELKELQTRLGSTSVYVTHDQEEAMALSDRIAVMRGGRIVETGAPADLYLRPKHPFTARFIGQSDLIDAQIVGRSGPAVLLATPFGTVESRNDLGLETGLAHLLVRPEHVELMDPSTRGHNHFPGLVERVTFLGKLADHDVRIGPIVIRCQAIASRRREKGEAVCVRLPPDLCLALPVETE